MFVTVILKNSPKICFERGTDATKDGSWTVYLAGLSGDFAGPIENGESFSRLLRPKTLQAIPTIPEKDASDLCRPVLRLRMLVSDDQAGSLGPLGQHGLQLFLPDRNADFFLAHQRRAAVSPRAASRDTKPSEE